ncbi:TNF receptor-associated factor 3-like isoform X2 [Dysidea avara]|uniref:TNF receptor-associated factor 3-like isoform X2 n=1 Tax=Dysidea avara TaxID=196820 RepID=UPI00331A79FE
MAAEKMKSKPKQDVRSVMVSEGGYDFDFVQSPPDDLLCNICQLPARDATLSVCCGHSFCKCCMDCYLLSNTMDCSSCLYCRKENFQSFPDKKTTRLVLNLQVFCPNKSQGCSWVGELRSVEDHLDKNSTASNIGCLFTEICCSNECGVVIQRRLLEDHLKLECELRQVKCEYCDSTGSYQWINGSHQQECLKYPMECPNHCEVGHVRREEMSVHLEECPLAIVKCPFAVVGCDIVVRREERMGHMKEAVEKHVECNKEAIVELERSKTTLKEQLSAKEQELTTVKNALQKAIDDKERELDRVRNSIDAIEDKLKAKDQELAVVKVTTENLKKSIDDKEKELRKNSEDSKCELEINMKQLKEMFEQELMKLREEVKVTKQQLQHQVEINEQLQQDLQSYDIPKLLPHLIGTGNQLIPFVIKLTEFEKRKSRQESWHSPPFYTSKQGYKMHLMVKPDGLTGNSSHVSVGLFLMKGEHDDQLTWPVKGVLSIQLLNQIGDHNHGELVKYKFDECNKACQRLVHSQSYGLSENIITHKKLYTFNGKWQYLKNDCIFFRVTNFQ